MNHTDPNPVTGVERPILSIKENGLLARAYRWSWRVTDVSNFCLLFWGTIFLPLGIALNHGLVPPVRKAVMRFDDWRYRRRKAKKMAEIENAVEDEPEPEPKRHLEVVVAIHAFFVRIWWMLSAAWKVLMRLRWLWVGFGVLFGLGILAAGVWGITLLVGVWDWHAFWEVLGFLGVILGCAVLLLGSSFVLFVIFESEENKEKAKRFFHGVWRAITFPFRFGYYGVLTVKHATCPVVEITSTQPSDQSGNGR